jgi:LPXTG-motif cell wall-anchored protein
MTLIGFIFLLVIAAIAGALGQGLAGYSLGGCLASLIVGFVGAYIGLWLARFFGLPIIFSINVQGESFPVVWAIIGSAILAGILGLFSRRRRFS